MGAPLPCVCTLHSGALACCCMLHQDIYHMIPYHKVMLLYLIALLSMAWYAMLYDMVFGLAFYW